MVTQRQRVPHNWGDRRWLDSPGRRFSRGTESAGSARPPSPAEQSRRPTGPSLNVGEVGPSRIITWALFESQFPHARLRAPLRPMSPSSVRPSRHSPP